MIRFFRQIRKNLMEQNKIRTYLFYAVGEIALVMIGILLALQVNNWNEDRIRKASEQDILKNLKSELIVNKEELQVIQKKHQRDTDAGMYFLSLFNTDVSNIPVSKLDSTLLFIESIWTFEPNDGYMKSLIGSGKIDLIQNVELKSLLASFDGKVIDATQEMDIIVALVGDRLWPAIDGKISSSNRVQFFEDYLDFPVGSYTSDYSWFFKNRSMEDLISNITSWKSGMVAEEEALIEIIDRMIYLIDNNLEN